MTLEEKISAHMKNLEISREEAIQLIADDNAIDHGAKLFSLLPQQEKIAKQARQADRKPTAYNFQKRERKENSDKRQLISMLADALNGAENVEISNAEREIIFRYNNIKYKIVLSCPRT